jgi:signal transduction histidine kinase
MLSLAAAALVVIALLALFAIELSNTQSKSKSDLEARVHDRGVLAAALLSSLLNSVEQQVPRLVALYGTRTVSDATLDAQRQGNLYLALLGSDGSVLASSAGFTAQARADLRISAALELVRERHPYGVGNVLPYGSTGVINIAVPFVTSFGNRILLTGVPPRTLAVFLTSDLREIPGVRGAHNYVIDANDAVLASTNRAIPPGHVFSPAQRRALAFTSGDRNGHYYVEARVANATWRVVLAAPNGPLFASISGLHEWLPWMIFIAFAIVAAMALVLGTRLVRSAALLRTSHEALERRASELARSNAELDQFASIASHDLQEPLRKVRTFTEQLRETEGAGLSERGRDYLERANSAAERMQRLVEDLLRFSRVATHGRPFGAVDLNEVTRGVLHDLELQIARSRATIELGELPTVLADELQMRQLMQNLVSNAIKFRRDGVDPEVTIGATLVDGEARIRVSDNGIGFEPAYADRVFRVFERLHGRGSYPGTGIGLALCRKIVSRHGGRITADGVLGEGATFTVTLPIRPAEDLFAPVNLTDADRRRREEEHVPA